MTASKPDGPFQRRHLFRINRDNFSTLTGLFAARRCLERLIIELVETRDRLSVCQICQDTLGAYPTCIPLIAWWEHVANKKSIAGMGNARGSFFSYHENTNKSASSGRNHRRFNECAIKH